MAGRFSANASTKREGVKKGTSIGNGRIKKASMNKHKKRSYKRYNGQGR
jgi:hypothetical protein